VQRDEGRPRGVGIRRRRDLWLALFRIITIELGPAAVVALLGEQLLSCRFHVGRRRLDLSECKQAEYAVLGVLGRGLDEPLADLLHAAIRPLLLLGGRKDRQTPQRHIARREWAGLGGRAAACVAPVILILLPQQQILGHRRGRLVRLPTAGGKRDQGVASRVGLAPLALSLKILLAVFSQEISDELKLRGQLCVVDRKALHLGGREGENRHPLLVTSETLLALGPMTDSRLHQ
jgi:hypothetical protein